MPKNAKDLVGASLGRWSILIPTSDTLLSPGKARDPSRAISGTQSYFALSSNKFCVVFTKKHESGPVSLF